MTRGDNALEGVPGAAGADKELDETQLCSSLCKIRSNGQILLNFIYTVSCEIHSRLVNFFHWVPMLQMISF